MDINLVILSKLSFLDLYTYFIYTCAQKKFKIFYKIVKINI